MLNSLQNPLALVGRVLIALLFIPAGWGKIGGFAGTAGYIASKGLPMPQVLAAGTIVLEIGAGLLLLIGLFTRWSALALAGFVLLASLFFHNYWAMPAEQQMMQSLMFWKNIAIIGGLLVIAAFGAGAFSVDAKRARA
jgi:putative oxidoreductase